MPRSAGRSDAATAQYECRLPSFALEGSCPAMERTPGSHERARAPIPARARFFTEASAPRQGARARANKITNARAHRNFVPIFASQPQALAPAKCGPYPSIGSEKTSYQAPRLLQCRVAAKKNLGGEGLEPNLPVFRKPQPKGPRYFKTPTVLVTR